MPTAHEGTRVQDNGGTYLRQRDILKLAGFGLNFLAVLCIGLVAWFAKDFSVKIGDMVTEIKEHREEVHALDKRVIKIENTRFELRDWTLAQKEIGEHILKVQEEMRRLWMEIGKFPKEIPPKHFESRVDRIEQEVHKHLEGHRENRKNIRIP